MYFSNKKPSKIDPAMVDMLEVPQGQVGTMEQDPAKYYQMLSGFFGV